jgi:hypothetical protein
MRTRFYSLFQSPDSNEGTLMNSKYSTERSPATALLYEAARTVILPLVRLQDGSPSVEVFLETRCAVACSVQEH